LRRLPPAELHHRAGTVPASEQPGSGRPTTHSDLILRAAAARKHVFCEKPVDLSVARAQACADAIATANVACMIGFQRRFDPTFNEAKARAQRGEIGTPEMLVITSRDPGAPPVDYIKQSGGIFRDMLIHDFDVFRWMLCEEGDEAVWLSATGSCLTDPAIATAGDVDSTAVTLRTRSGRLCQINTSRRAAYGYDQRFELLGSKGLLACGNHRPTEVLQMDGQGVRTDLPENFFLQRYREAYRLELAHFSPIWASQDPGAARLKVLPGETPATVNVSFDYPANGERIGMKFFLQQSGARWLIDDIQYGDGRRLGKILEARE